MTGALDLASHPPPDIPPALGREEALRGILDIISASRADTGPVFERILENACQLCAAPFAGLYLVDALATHADLVASLGARPEYLDRALTRWPLANPASIPSAINSGATVHIPDLADTDLYRAGDQRRVEAVDIEGIRTFLAVPLMQGGRAIGAIGLYRREVTPFTPDQIALVETFAAQAVIAIENVRQFQEVQERLEREQAVKNILRVISESPDDEQPTFEAILDSATRLCGTPYASLVLGRKGDAAQVMVAHRHSTPETVRHYADGKVPMDPRDSLAAQAILEGRTILVPDMAATQQYKEGHPRFKMLVDDQGLRTNLFVPLISPTGGIGCFILWKKEPVPFTEDQIALVETFASHAVIAIENVRQFREVQERLERETALAEILQVISQSRDDEWPVFDVILKSAARLCHAPLADLDLLDPDGAHLREVATYGEADRVIPSDRWVWSMDGPHYHVEAVRTGKVIHIHDLRESENYRSRNPMTVAAVDTENMRTLLAVPLRSGDRGIGCLVLFRQEVRPFAEDEIALVETFAAQAVIAIENVRQFREVQERLRREEASREILQMISASRTDPAPVFDVLLRNAAHLSGAPLANLCLLNAARSHWNLVAHFGEGLRHLTIGTTERPLDSQLVPAVTMRTARIVHIEDLADTDLYRQGDPGRVAMVESEGMRTILCVPLLSETGAIGCITLFRREVQAFTNDEIGLIETFAAQAVIAIENVHQFREIQERLRRERASAEILEVISQSREDEKPVFDAILENACALCNAPLAGLILGTAQDATQTLAAHRGMFPAAIELYDTGQMPMDATLSYAAQSIIESRLIAFEDMGKSDLYQANSPVVRAMVDESGVRSVLFVPLIKDGKGIGNLTLFRREVKPFDQSEISLVETFAAQAVIAIENVRQFREVQERLEREKATKEVLSVISQSRDDEIPVFTAILKLARELCEAETSFLSLINSERTHLCFAGRDGTHFNLLQPGFRVALDDPMGVTTAARTGQIVHNPDLKNDDLYRQGHPQRVKLVDVEGIRSQLAVPLQEGDQTIGVIALNRREAKAFTESEIALIESFAAQAVIAIENVRQFREVQERLEREKASGEILGVISQSRDDETPVFDAILDNACRLCDAPLAFLSLLEDTGTHFRVPAHRGASPEMARVWNTQTEPIEGSTLTTSQAISERRIVQVDDLAAVTTPDTADRRRAQLVQLEQVRSYLVIPLIRGAQAIGTINLYRREVRPFTPDQIALVETFAAQAVIAIENVRQFKALEALNAELESRVEDQVGEIERMGRLKRFLPAAVADTVISSGSEKMLSSHRALLGVLFCDIRGFTAFCETAEPEETIEVLQTYHQEMGKLINEHGAGVDHRMGDGIMVLFNDPVPCDDPAGEAVRLALAMRERMADLCRGWKRLGHRLGFGVGVAMGYATVGMVGYEGRFDYTASGTAVNLAARLCDEAEDGEILLSPRASIAVEDDFAVESKGEVTLKGIREPVEIFRLATG